jgi:hypothetical protein
MEIAMPTSKAIVRVKQNYLCMTVSYMQKVASKCIPTFLSLLPGWRMGLREGRIMMAGMGRGLLQALLVLRTHLVLV